MADKTEAPSSQRLEEARKEGQVVRSQELNTAVIILASTFLLQGPGAQLGVALKQIVITSLVDLPHTDISVEWVRGRLFLFGGQVLLPMIIVLVGILLTGVIVTVAQTQFLWAGKKIGFDFKRVNPIDGFKRIFSTHGLIELLRSLLKLGWVSWVAYGFLQSVFAQIISFTQFEFLTAISQFIEMCFSLSMRIGGMYLVLAAADYAYQRWEMYKNLRMSKEELKEENKRSEGDPLMKSRMRAMQRQLARGRMMSNVPKATVVITNPTHLAIAIEYKEGMRAPKVLAKGPYRVAERIVKIAKENRIPVVQNIPLARAMYKTIEIGQEISPELYLAMAEVLAYVYKLQGKTPVRPQPSAPSLSMIGNK